MTRVHLCPTGQRYSLIHAAGAAGALDAFRFRSRYFTDAAAMPHLGHFSSSMASVLRLGEKTETAKPSPYEMFRRQERHNSFEGMRCCPRAFGRPRFLVRFPSIATASGNQGSRATLV